MKILLSEQTYVSYGEGVMQSLEIGCFETFQQNHAITKKTRRAQCQKDRCTTTTFVEFTPKILLSKNYLIAQF